MFGTVLEKLSGWFGQSFLVARFFPLLVCLAMNGAIAFFAVPTVRPRLQMVLNATAASTAGPYVLLALGAIAALAYTLSPFVRGAVQVLEGGWMLAPGANRLSRWIGERLVAEQSQRQDELAERRSELFQDRGRLPLQRDVRRRLSDARATGATLRDIAYPALIEAAEAKLASLLRLRAYQRPIPAAELNEAIELIEEALRLNCADLGALKSVVRKRQHAWAERLSRLQRQMVSVLVVYALAVAEGAESLVVDRLDQEFAPGELAPLSFGNLSAGLRSYCKTRYGMEFDYFWPRFLLAIQKNQGLSAPIATANTQVEFALVSIILTTLSVVLWFAFFLTQQARSLPLFLVTAIGPPLIGFWMEAVRVSYREYAATVRSAIDLGRFDVLSALHYPLPPTLEAERRLWEGLARRAKLDERAPDRAFAHTAGSAKT